MTGFRMSFRTEVIQQLRTSTRTSAATALFEDVDASLRVLDTHCLVAANRARVYHHKVPGSRDAERTLGEMYILNRGYVLSKHKPLGRRIVSDAYLFCFYKSSATAWACGRGSAATGSGAPSPSTGRSPSSSPPRPNSSRPSTATCASGASASD